MSVLKPRSQFGGRIFMMSERGGGSILRKGDASPWEKEAEEMVTRKGAQKGEETM